MMARQTRSAEEIQAEVSRLLVAAAVTGHGNPGITVPLPERIVEARPDECNWDMTWFGQSIPDPEAVEVAIEDVKARWNLR
jgi:hypothetical protein